MENPYKEPPKKCVLCGIHVNYKNVQVSFFTVDLCCNYLVSILE